MSGVTKRGREVRHQRKEERLDGGGEDQTFRQMNKVSVDTAHHSESTTTSSTSS